MINERNSNQYNYLIDTKSSDEWRRVGVKRRAGVLVPLFSIYSKDSIGIGEIPDLKLLIDWCVKTGNSIIQLLPMNEMGSLFCPYDSISSFALEPAHLSLKQIVGKKDKSFNDRLEALSKSFAIRDMHINYAIKEQKILLLRDIYLSKSTKTCTGLENFKKTNAFWLVDFALFKVIKDFHKGLAWYEWEDAYRKRDKLALEDFRKRFSKEIDFEIWLQWQLYEQFKEVKEYAKKKRILLKGDLPILVSRDSSDVWANPHFFKLEFAAGAPVDMYCAKGQRWGMPTYNWEKIAYSGFNYLKEKLKYAQNFYDILRIDHVVGLFRIWSIPFDEPLDNQGLIGSFDPPNERSWGEHGRRILSIMLENADMLLCGEDLGIIPSVCPETLKELGILGNDVQRWVKDWNILHDFIEPEHYRAESVIMLSNHDTTNWPAWWENEAGTIDEALFIRICAAKKINYASTRGALFDLGLSVHGRLRWLSSIDSIDKLVAVLGKSKEEVEDIIDMYQNTFLEKEKLWEKFKLKGKMREKCDPEIMRKVFEFTLQSRSIFCINTIIDYLYLGDFLSGDPYSYRINKPGTINDRNWSLTIPCFLEDLLNNKINKDILCMIKASLRK